MATCILPNSTTFSNNPLATTQFFNTTQTGFVLTSVSSGHCLILQYELPAMTEVCRQTPSSDCSTYQVIPNTSTTTSTGTLLSPGSATQGPLIGVNPGGNPQQVIPPSFPTGAPGPESPHSSSSKISTGAIIGAAVGGVVVVVVALALLVTYRRKSRQRRGAAGGRKRLGSGLNVFEEEVEDGEEKNNRPGQQQQQHNQFQGRELSDDTLVQVQDRSLGGEGGPSFHIPPLPTNSPMFKATPTANQTFLVPTVPPPPLHTIDYKPRSTYQPPIQHHAGTGNRDEGGQNDYIDLIPVEDTPQMSHAALPTALVLNRDKGKARAMDIEEEFEDSEAERRGLLILGSGSSGSQPPNQQQQQQPQQQSTGGGSLSATVEEDDEEINEEEIKYL